MRHTRQDSGVRPRSRSSYGPGVTTVDHYKPNLRDTLFQLFEVLAIQSTALGKAPFQSMDEDAARAALEAFLEVMLTSWAPAFAEGDRIGARFDGHGNVTLPPG